MLISTEFLGKFKRMAYEPQFYDLTVIVGTGKEKRKIGCNRSLLCAHCPVFEAMFFQSKMMEAQNSVVEIPDVSAKVFRAMLHWMATETIDLKSIDLLQPLLKLADKYQIHLLLQSASLYLKTDTMLIYVVTDHSLTKYRGIDLGLQYVRNNSNRVRILKHSSVKDVTIAIAKTLGINTQTIFQKYKYLCFCVCVCIKMCQGYTITKHCAISQLIFETQ